MVEGLAFCLVFCFTLAALVFVIPVLCFLICVPYTVGVYGPPRQFALNKTLPTMLNFGFSICLITTKICIGTG